MAEASRKDSRERLSGHSADLRGPPQGSGFSRRELHPRRYSGPRGWTTACPGAKCWRSPAPHPGFLHPVLASSSALPPSLAGAGKFSSCAGGGELPGGEDRWASAFCQALPERSPSKPRRSRRRLMELRTAAVPNGFLEGAACLPRPGQSGGEGGTAVGAGGGGGEERLPPPCEIIPPFQAFGAGERSGAVIHKT